MTLGGLGAPATVVIATPIEVTKSKRWRSIGMNITLHGQIGVALGLCRALSAWFNDPRKANLSPSHPG